MPTKKKPIPEDSLGLERIIFFSDAVMAIAITLLAIDLKLPQIDPSHALTEVPGQLATIRPNFMAFFISFVVIGIYWISHHRYFAYIKRYDVRLMVLNLMFLFFIVCMPFVASLLGQYTSVPIVLILYTSAVAALGISMALIWWYASSHHLLAEELDAQSIRMVNIRLYTSPVMFLAAIPFAFVSSTAVIIVWWLSPLAVLAAMRIFGREADHKRSRS
ncbi:MAG TPA: TMEM175 family protein [Anaerolineales bacterium]|nr:TMEM175 family protein [Anaerolineales bacterium]